MALTSDLTLNVNTYKYKIEILYVKPQTGESVAIEPIQVMSICVDNNYSGANMPQIYITASLDQKFIKDMVDNRADNLINLTVYKFNDSADIELDELYFRQQYMYFINDTAGYVDVELQYDGDNEDRNDLFRDVQIGLLQLDIVNKNKNTISTVLSNTTMTNAIYTVTSHMNILLEPLLYDTTLDQLIIPPTDSVAEIIKYLDSNKVFYNTTYRYFVDNDVTYILSSSGISTEKDGDIHDRVIIELAETGKDVTQNIAGMGEKNNGYYIYIGFGDSQTTKDASTEKRFNQISSVSTDGDSSVTELENINKSSYTSSKSKSVRIRQDNPNAIKNLKSSVESSSIKLSLNKNDVDTSVLTPNKQYIVYNGVNNDNNGVYILNRKRELFIREGINVYMINVMLDLSRVDPEKLIESSGADAASNTTVINSLFGNKELNLDNLL